MDENKIKEIINAYMEAYNNFNIDAMLEYLHEDFEFRNITKRKIEQKIKGREKFREKALQSASFFKDREQKIKEWKITSNNADLKVEFTGLPVVDIPLGQKIGNKRIRIKGRSVFKFKDDKIILIEDYS